LTIEVRPKAVTMNFDNNFIFSWFGLS